MLNAATQQGLSPSDLRGFVSLFFFGVAFNEDRLDPLLCEPDTMDTPADVIFAAQGSVTASAAKRENFSYISAMVVRIELL